MHQSNQALPESGDPTYFEGMSNVVTPPGEKLRRALHWISEERTARPQSPMARIIEEASVRFDLSPAEEEWLLRTIQPAGSK
jgi:hypothetical protein